MKIRTDFVTNSSSSSFILGGPGEHNLTIKNAEKYLDIARSKLGLSDKIECDFMIDLKYDPAKSYSMDDIHFVIETIFWYVDYEPANSADEIIFDENDIAYVHDASGNRVKLNEFAKSYTRDEIKAILDYAHQHFGEILVGNGEVGFRPWEFYYDVVAKSDDIVYHCNHMG